MSARSFADMTPREAMADGGRMIVVWALCEMPYSEYLKTNHWKDVRLSAIRRAGGKCSLCRESAALHVHHKTYERRGEELPGDVIAVCAACHSQIHDTIQAAMRAEHARIFNP